MAAPTITWYYYEGAGQTETPIGAGLPLDYGNVQAGHFSDAKAIRAKFSGTANTLKFWLNDIDSNKGNIGNADGWTHNFAIDTTYSDPIATAFDDDVKNGTDDIPGLSGVKMNTLGESEPLSSNFEKTTIDNANDYTDFIYLTIQPPSDADDGIHNSFSYRTSFLYP